MHEQLKRYETKYFGGIEFYDYWDLRNHPLYIKADKKIGKPYMKFDEVHFDGAVKVSSLSDISHALMKLNWTSEDRYWKYISRTIQSMVNIPWTPH